MVQTKEKKLPTMYSKIILFLFFFLSNATAFNITSILEGYPEFSTFNSYLTQTHIADTINARTPPMTVLVVDNANVSPLSDKTPEVLQKIMNVHVILDYFDVSKIKNMAENASAVTLFQATGQAVNNQGFITITNLGSFSSGASGSGASLVKSVTSQPYSLSVLQISNVIVPSGIDKAMNTSSSSGNSTSPSSAPPVPAPAPSPTNSSFGNSTSPSLPPVSPVPAPSPANSSSGNSTSPALSPVSPVPAPSPTNTSSGNSTSPSPAPESPTPTASPTESPAKSPTHSPAPSPRKILSPAPSADAEAPESDKESESSFGTALGVSAGVVAAVATSSLFLVIMV